MNRYCYLRCVCFSPFIYDHDNFSELFRCPLQVILVGSNAYLRIATERQGCGYSAWATLNVSNFEQYSRTRDWSTGKFIG
jgi:hypothetical protein